MLDLEYLLRHSPFQHPRRTYKHLLQKMTVCANCSVRSVYTSDLLYAAKDFPKEMAFKLPSQKDTYDKHFNYETFPSQLRELYQEEMITKKREETH